MTQLKVTIHRNALKAASRFSAVKDIRYYLNGVLVESSPLETRLVATDGHAMLVHRSGAKEENEGAWSGIIPNDAVKAMLAWKGDKNSKFMPFTLTVLSATEVRADWVGQSIIFRPIDGTFPDYRKVIPTEISGEPAYFDPKLLMRVRDAADDLRTCKSEECRFSQTMNGERGAIFPIDTDCFAIVMPLRNVPRDVADYDWSRQPVPALAADMTAAEVLLPPVTQDAGEPVEA